MSDLNVISLNGHASSVTSSIKPNAELVTVLENLLVQARAGSLQSLAWVEVHIDRGLVRGSVALSAHERDLASGIGDLFFATYGQREAEYAERAGLASADGST